MPHGTPDWGLVGPKRTTYGLDDLGEHAVRLGSPHFFDRRGDVMWQTDFREGLGDMTVTLSGLGSVGQLLTGYSRTGPYCLGMVAGSTANWNGLFAKDIPYSVASSFGVECSFSHDLNVVDIDFTLQFHTPTVLYDGSILWTRVGSTLDYKDVLGARIPFAAGVPTTRLDRVCNTMKFVVDMVNYQYVRVLWNNIPYSLAGIGCDRTGPPGALRIVFLVSVVGANGTNARVNMDNVIITQNEP